jgi:hypothetical protein
VNVAPLIFGLLAAFGVIGFAVGAWAYRRRPARCWAHSLRISLAGAYAGGVLFGFALLDIEAGLAGAPIAALMGALALVFVKG